MANRRAHPAESVNKVIDRVLLTLGDAGPVLAGTKEFHMQEATKAAEMIGCLYSEIAKKKARKDCVSHLRAFLSRSGATEASISNIRTDSV